MKSLTLTLVGAAALALALGTAQLGAAQAQKKGGGSHSMTGCLQKGDEANTFRLTNVQGKVKNVEIVDVASGVDLSPHVGHKVTITGTAVSAKQAASKEGAGTMKRERGGHHMRVDQVKMVSTTCP